VSIMSRLKFLVYTFSSAVVISRNVSMKVKIEPTRTHDTIKIEYRDKLPNLFKNRIIILIQHYFSQNMLILNTNELCKLALLYNLFFNLLPSYALVSVLFGLIRTILINTNILSLIIR